QLRVVGRDDLEPEGHGTDAELVARPEERSLHPHAVDDAPVLAPEVLEDEAVGTELEAGGPAGDRPHRRAPPPLPAAGRPPAPAPPGCGAGGGSASRSREARRCGRPGPGRRGDGNAPPAKPGPCSPRQLEPDAALFPPLHRHAVLLRRLPPPLEHGLARGFGE